MDTLAIKEDLERVCCSLEEDQSSKKSIDTTSISNIVELNEISLQLASAIQALQQELGIIMESMDNVEPAKESAITTDERSPSASTYEKSTDEPVEEDIL